MRILIGYNGTDYSKAALDDLMNAGLPHNTEALVLTVAEVCLSPDNRDDAGKMAAFGAERIKNAFPDWTVISETAYGTPAREILTRAESFEPGLIVVGERQQKLSERNIFLGHASQMILTEAKCSVRIGRGRKVENIRPENIIVGFDGSPGSELAVASIADRKWPAGTSVSLLAVADSSVLGSIGRFIPQMNNASLEAKFASQWAETLAADSVAKLVKAGLNATVEVQMGHPKDTIIEMAETSNADCIFVGPHCSGNSFERFLLGSVSAAVAARAHCSVEVVRPYPIDAAA